ncbi:MAG: hypothetical protein KDA27_27145, partial [Candidatus Eisenbacteria bacterium]|nr:hypothetical protein [Candidatus Eisenbacteria bacterium]
PAWAYMATVRLWKRARSYFHYYCHSFEMGGMSYRGRLPYRGRAARTSTRIYLLRCNGRESLFSRILSSFPFRPIEDCFQRSVDGTLGSAVLEDRP